MRVLSEKSKRFNATFNQIRSRFHTEKSVNAMEIFFESFKVMTLIFPTTANRLDLTRGDVTSGFLTTRKTLTLTWFPLKFCMSNILLIKIKLRRNFLL